MNDNIDPHDAPEGAWLTRDHRMSVRDTSMLTGSEKAPAATVASLHRVGHAAHGAVDRLADSAAPRLRQLGARVAGAEVALHEKADQLGRTRDEWTEVVRVKVRSHPLAAVAVAVAIGAVILRITRHLRPIGAA